MICGDRIELFLEPILPEDKGTVELFGSLAELLQTFREGYIFGKSTFQILEFN